MKKFFTLTLSALLVLSLLAGCGGGSDTTTTSDTTADDGDAATTETTTTLKVGASITPHAEILEQCKPILAEQGIDLEIVEYTDYVQPNTAVEEGDLDATTSSTSTTSTGSMRTTAPTWWPPAPSTTSPSASTPERSPLWMS